MADVVTRFRLETAQYDSKLRDASRELADFAKKATKAGNEFSKFTRENVEAARALGNITPSANNAKDKVRELVGAFNDVARAYNNLTKEQQQSDFGRAMSASLDQLKVKIREAKQEMNSMGNTMNNVGGGGMFSGIGDKLSGALQVFGGNMMTKAAGAIASLGNEMVGMVQQGVELARQSEGIRIAFERLGRGDILDGLRQATHGTVTDLELMKAAVKFNDFNLPLEELGTMLAFAQQKAKDTGQSVDDMVDSIVTGLGRKSLMILDNLGLSATEVRDKIGETGDMTKAVGEIIRDRMAKAGEYVETAADRAAQANVGLQNKMEELGRKFAPVEEASNQLWTSMKIAILDVVGGPLARLLNDLTEAGRMKNALDKMNGDGSGDKPTKVQGQLNNLKNLKASGMSNNAINSAANYRIADYNKQIETLQKQIDGAREMQKKNIGGIAGTKGFNDSMNDLIAQRDALTAMRDEYMKGVKEITKPVEVKIKTDNAKQDVESLRVKLSELEAQRKKAIEAGDTDLSKNLLKQINQTKADIKGLSPSSTTATTTHTATPQERAATAVENAERTYAETLTKNSIRLEAGIDTELENKKKALSAQERLFDAYNDAYATYADPKYKHASTEAADKIRLLADEVKAAADAQDAAKKATQELEQAQKKLADAQKKLSEARTTGSATSVYKAQQEVNRQQTSVDAIKMRQGSGTVKMKVELETERARTAFESLKQTIQSEIKLDQMTVDEATLRALLTTAMQNGLDSVTVDYAGLQEKIAKGIDIPDSTWQSLQDEINAKLAEMGIPPITIDFKTGKMKEVKDDAKETQKAFNMAASAVQQMGSAMSSIEDPSMKAAGTVMQAIASIALGFATASAQGNTAGTGWGWLAWLAAGAAAMATTISTIHSLTGMEQGGMVKGVTYSGDQIMANNGQIGLNAGEVVLTHAMQGNLAAQLEDTGGQPQGGVTMRPYTTGENIYLGMSTHLRRTGQGEIVTTSMLRRLGLI